MGVPKRAVARMVAKALAEGLQPADFSAPLRRFLAGITLHSGEDGNIRVYNHHVFLFANNVLITAWRLPTNWQRPTAHV